MSEQECIEMPQPAVSPTYWQVRQAAAWWWEPETQLIEVSGPEAASYLQTQITQDVLKLEPGQGALAALVDRKAHIRSLFSLHRSGPERFWLLPQAQGEALFQHLEQFHFSEKLVLSQQQDWLRLRLEGPGSPEIISQFSGQSLVNLPRFSIQSVALPGGSAWLIPDSLSGESGALLLLKAEYREALISLLQTQLGLPELEAEALEMLRLEAGWPRYGPDMDSETQLPETGLEKQMVSYDKGCYLGQEVMARIRTYGVVPRALIGLVFADAAPQQAGDLRKDGKSIGRLTSLGWSPQLQRPVALAYLHKKWRESGQQLSFDLDGQSYSAEVRRLPLYTPSSASEQAQELYQQALLVFAEADESQAIPLLQAAIRKDPLLADAYESLGVMLSRQGQHQEAIAVMQQLTEVDPAEPMAHTNLSRFHMLLGDKDTAEAHMAEATRLNMLKQQASVQAQQMAQREREQKQQMMAMFQEVLEHEDPQDLVANFGLGKALADFERYAEAVPYLQQAVAIDPFYSAAYLQLGKALEQTGEREAARGIYARGIEAAAEKGDLMPLKEMEQRRAALA